MVENSLSADISIEPIEFEFEFEFGNVNVIN